MQRGYAAAAGREDAPVGPAELTLSSVWVTASPCSTLRRSARATMLIVSVVRNRARPAMISALLLMAAMPRSSR